MNIIEFYHKARLFVIKEGFSDEIKWCRERYFKNIDKKEFAFEYTFAVLASSGLREQVVRKNYNKFLDAGKEGKSPFATVNNQRQRNALIHVWSDLDKIFKTLKMQLMDEEKIEYLDTLPQIGPKAKYHLARNLGIDCVKPDRHMERLAENFHYPTPLAMCEDIQRQLIEQERVGVIDVILWRYCNLTGEFE
jgi:hypothetical protein